MASKFPFSYSEIFLGNTLNSVPEALRIKGNADPNVLLIIRLLSGSIDFEHSHSGKQIKQRNNYFANNFKGYGQQWRKKFPKLIAEDYTAEQLGDYIASLRSNKTFYKNLLSELSYFCYYEKKKSHTNAFLFLYRSLEHLSYAFPLIYVSKTDDFKSTYGFLKDLMKSNKESGELGFFKSFVNTIYKDDPIRESSIDINIHFSNQSYQEDVFKLLHGICKDNFISESTQEPSLLSINYPFVGAFIITLRNRFFHFMNGVSGNIESSKVLDVDELFSLMNKELLYWITTVFLGVIAHSATDFERQKASIRNA